MDYKEALNKYIEAINTHDFNNVEKALDPNAIYWFSDKTCTTTQDIKRYFENAWEVIKDEVYSATDIVWIATDLNTATCIYTYNWEGYREGKFVSGSGRATNVFRRNDDGEWRLIHEHLSRE